MGRLEWNRWFRSKGCRHWMDRTFFAGVSFTNIFYQGMNLVFMSGSHAAGILYTGEVFAASQAIVAANGSRNDFSEADQKQYLLNGLFKYGENVNYSLPLIFLGPDSEDLKTTQYAEAPIHGSVIAIHFYNLVLDAQNGTGAFQPKGALPQNADGVTQLAYFTAAVVLHEIMHNHGFGHENLTSDWRPGTPYASTLPQVALQSVLNAAKARLGTTSLPLNATIMRRTFATPVTEPSAPAVPEYNALFEKGGGRYMLRGWTQDDLKKEAQKVMSENYRLIDQVRYGPSSALARYDAIFKPSNKKHKEIWSYDFESLKNFEANLFTKGFKMVHQLSYPTSQGRRYDAIFIEREGDRRILWGWTLKHLRAEQRVLKEKGFYLHHQHSYPIGSGERRYDAIFLKLNKQETATPTRGKSWFVPGLTRYNLHKQIAYFHINLKSTLHHLQSYRNSNGVILCDVIFRFGERECLVAKTQEELVKVEGELWKQDWRIFQHDRA